MYQEKYWKELYALKVHLNYLELYMEDSEFNDTVLNVILAISSSSSIAAWVIWKDAGIIWAAIIAISQVITTIKNFLPYKSRIKAIGGLLHEIDDIVLYTEKKWFDVSEGKLTEEEIHELQFEIKTKKTKALKKHLGNSTLPVKCKLLNKAEASASIYFDNYYPTEG